MKSITRYYPLILFISALAVRSIYFYQFQNNPFFDHIPEGWDQTNYDRGAQAFANGNFLAADPDSSNHFSPLYQYFLGIIYWFFGRNLTIVWLIQFLLGITSTLLIYLIANHYFKPIVSLIAGLLFTFYGVNWLYESTLYRAAFATFLELVSCFMLIRFAKNPNLVWMTLSAVSLSLFMQSRTNYVLVVPFALVYLWGKVFCNKDFGRKFLTFYLLIFLFTSIPLLGWVRVVHGDWGFYDQSGPENLLMANMAGHDARIYEHNENYIKISKKIPMETLSILNYIFQSAWNHPLDFLQIYLWKIYYYFNNYEAPNTLNFYLFQEFSPILNWGSIPFSLIGSLGIMGFVLFWKHQKGPTLLHGYFLANLLMFLPFLVLSRYRLTMVPFLAMFSAYSLWVSFQRIKQKNYSSLSVLVICIVLLNFVQKTDPLPEGKIRIIDYSNVGAVFLNNTDKEDDFKSYSYYKRAWELSRSLEPEQRRPVFLLKLFSKYYIKEAEKYNQINNLNKELEALEKAVYFDHSQATTHYNYALALYNKQRFKEAFFHNLQALEINQNLYSAHLLIGLIYNDSLQMSLWSYYHWQKAYEIMADSEEKKSTSLQIKNLQDQIIRQNPDFQSYDNNFTENIRHILQEQIVPFIKFQKDLTLPDTISKWSSSEIEQYLISLYQRLILFSESNDAIIYYQLGMFYWKKFEDESVAFFYFKKSWDRGIKFQDFADVLNAMQERLGTKDIL